MIFLLTDSSRRMSDLREAARLFSRLIVVLSWIVVASPQGTLAVGDGEIGIPRGPSPAVSEASPLPQKSDQLDRKQIEIRSDASLDAVLRQARTAQPGEAVFCASGLGLLQVLKTDPVLEKTLESSLAELRGTFPELAVVRRVANDRGEVLIVDVLPSSPSISRPEALADLRRRYAKQANALLKASPLSRDNRIRLLACLPNLDSNRVTGSNRGR